MRAQGGSFDNYFAESLGVLAPAFEAPADDLTAFFRRLVMDVAGLPPHAPLELKVAV